MTAADRTAPAGLLTPLPQPTVAYKRRVWLAVAGLALFLTLYFLLAFWFLLTAYRLTLGADAPNFAGLLVAGCALFLALFMLKPLFFVKRGDVAGAIEVTRAEQPRLFAFLDRLADSAAAPRPHKVFLSARVNAGVFYDLSFVNLFLPSKKNLDIGLALVNALSLGEFRAVLAHEFGHFSQRSMAVGRWVYLADQIAAYLVMRRDKLDEMLDGLSRVDVRVAWVGWVLSLIVWSIRSLVHSAFVGVHLLERALSREMELQADLVAVALTGSDALINALHRICAADDAWDRTLAHLGGERAGGRFPRDAFALQSCVVERMREVWSDPAYGNVPPIGSERPADHRVFKPELAQPPRMWLTHPPNHEREGNVKRNYVAASIDDRSAWTLFDQPAALREHVSAVLLESIGKETVPVEQSIAALNQDFEREYLKTRYRGVYLGRSVVRSASGPDALLEPPSTDWRQKLDQLYPESLVAEVTRVRELAKELGQLRAIQSGALKPPDEVIRHRGRVIRRLDLPRVIEELEREAKTAEDRLGAEDRLCRTVHLAAATELGGGWEPYLRGLHAVLHYADHAAANVRDLHGVLVQTWNVVAATRRVSSSGLKRLLAAANALYEALAELFRESKLVTLDPSLTRRLGAEGKSWEESLGKFGLVPADKANIGEWLKVIDGWVNQAASACEALRSGALEQLLRTEAAVAERLRQGTSPGEAPAPSTVGAKYAVLLPGTERKRPSGLTWWQRFQIADGVLPALARFAVAAGIVAVVLGFGSSVGAATITIYNGLSRAVVVRVAGRDVALGPVTSQAVPIDGGATYRIEARTDAGQVIEAFDAAVPGSFANWVYNVGGAAPLVEWTAVYGSAQGRPERLLGAPRWSKSAADVLFAKPPESISSGGAGGVRLVVTGMADASPSSQLSLLASAADRQRAIGAHARWDATNTAWVVYWLALAERELPDYGDVLAARLTETPNDVVLLRAEQDRAGPPEKAAVCARHQARAAGAPGDADLAYVVSRCLGDDRAQAQAFLDGYRRWPTNGWFAQAAGYSYAEAGEWRQAIAPLERGRRAVRPLAERIAVDLARIHRLITPQSEAVVTSLARGSEALRYYVGLESGRGMDSGPLLAYVALERGDLRGAVRRAHADPEVEARVLRLAAASDGASPELVRRAVALERDAGLDQDTRWASIGLAARLGRDIAPFVDSTGSGGRGQVERVLAFIERMRRGTNLPAAEELLHDVHPWLRGQAYSVGVIVLRDRAPRSWRQAAKRLLFASERPYFR